MQFSRKSYLGRGKASTTKQTKAIAKGFRVIDLSASPEMKLRFERLPADVRAFWGEPLQYVAGEAPPSTLSKEWVYKSSGLPWLKLPIAFPVAEMLAEAEGVLERFAWHRSDSSKGWNSLCLRGLSARQTLSAKYYGHASEREAPYVWTEIADMCPTTANYFQTQFACETLFRVRYMLLEPGGYIAPHKDRPESRLSGVNIALNMPKGCFFGMQGGGVLPLSAGDAFLLDTANLHSFINLSDTPRVHMIVHCADPTPEWDAMVCESYCQHLAQYSGEQERAA